MSGLDDLRTAGDHVLEQVAQWLPQLPRPLSAAIGAGDLAAEQWAEIGRAVQGAVSVGGRPEWGSLPARAGRAAGGAVESWGRRAAGAPARVREVVAELPSRAGEVARSVSQQGLRDAVGAYVRLAGIVYGNLAGRGDRTWSRFAEPGVVSGSVVPDVGPPTPTPDPTAPPPIADSLDTDPAANAADDLAPTSTRAASRRPRPNANDVPITQVGPTARRRKPGPSTTAAEALARERRTPSRGRPRRPAGSGDQQT